MTVMTVIRIPMRDDRWGRCMTVLGLSQSRTVTIGPARGVGRDARDGLAADRAYRVWADRASPRESEPLDARRAKARSQPLEGSGQGGDVLRPTAFSRGRFAGDLGQLCEEIANRSLPVAPSRKPLERTGDGRRLEGER